VGSVLIIGNAAMAEQGPGEVVTNVSTLAACDVGLGPIPPTGRLGAERRSVRKALTIEDAIDLCVESDMESFDAPGAAVAVVLDGELLYERGYGEKLRGSNDLVDPDTIFRIGQITQQMTAAAVMQQVELGRVALTDPVTDFIPEFKVSGRWPAESITVWHTLTHSTGFPDDLDSGGAQNDNALSRWAARQDNVRLFAPPGSFWNYSNPNFMLAGLIAERAGGTPYRRLFRQSLWEPAGMDSTTFDPAEVRETGNFAFGHCWVCSIGDEVIVPPEENDLWDAGPAGIAFSTVGDLASWALLLMDGGGEVLSPWSASTMQDKHLWTHLTPDLFTGFGIMSEDYQGLDTRFHTGSIQGFGAHLLWVPERRFAVALLVNQTSTLTVAAHCIVDAVLEPDAVDEPDLTTDPLTWKRYGGDYIMTETDGYQTDFLVYLEDDRLMAAVVDPAAPNVVYLFELVQAYLDTFLLDSNADGTPDMDFTFCSRSGKPGFMMWIRNRFMVGERRLPPRTAGRALSP
jgi:CubicO group peptidase (beta-lactamase class C family)